MFGFEHFSWFSGAKIPTSVECAPCFPVRRAMRIEYTVCIRVMVIFHCIHTNTQNYKKKEKTNFPKRRKIILFSVTIITNQLFLLFLHKDMRSFWSHGQDHQHMTRTILLKNPTLCKNHFLIAVKIVFEIKNKQY